jgi:Response regulator containing CheY-like receiver domain and AraC-type DNA-binding domain
MLNILIVDDEKIERQGIRYLISKYSLELNIIEAEDGETALDFIKSLKVDILFTDIKIPFMDGLELAAKSRTITPDLKIIIFSAYGEFDYARKAISISALDYIMKPIDDNEFLNVITKVIGLCEKEKLDQEKNKIINDIFTRNAKYEKEKILMDIINGIEINEDYLKIIRSVGIDFTGKYILLVLIDFRSAFYNLYNEEFERVFKDITKLEYEYLNLNERQSVVFLKGNKDEFERAALQYLGELIRTKLDEKYHMISAIVLGNLLEDIRAIGMEYNHMEAVLDYKFFFEGSIVLFSDGNLSKDLFLPDNFDNILSNIYKCIECNDYYNLDNLVRIFFKNLDGHESFSVVYIKYICMDIIKRIYDKKSGHKKGEFENNLEIVYTSSTLFQLAGFMKNIISEMYSENLAFSEERKKKFFYEILKIIENNYMNDISLEWIAEKVYITPNYLSYIFKRDMGISLTKYITTYKLEKAKDLLLNTNMKIVDISEKVGYSTPSYFCQTFKSYYGFTPAKLREK